MLQNFFRPLQRRGSRLGLSRTLFPHQQNPRQNPVDDTLYNMAQGLYDINQSSGAPQMREFQRGYTPMQQVPPRSTDPIHLGDSDFVARSGVNVPLQDPPQQPNPQPPAPQPVPVPKPVQKRDEAFLQNVMGKSGKEDKDKPKKSKKVKKAVVASPAKKASPPKKRSPRKKQPRSVPPPKNKTPVPSPSKNASDHTEDSSEDSASSQDEVFSPPPKKVTKPTKKSPAKRTPKTPKPKPKPLARGTGPKKSTPARKIGNVTPASTRSRRSQKPVEDESSSSSGNADTSFLRSFMPRSSLKRKAKKKDLSDDSAKKPRVDGSRVPTRNRNFTSPPPSPKTSPKVGKKPTISQTQRTPATQSGRGRGSRRIAVKQRSPTPPPPPEADLKSVKVTKEDFSEYFSKK